MLRYEIALMESLSYEGRTIIEGRSGIKRAWGSLWWEEDAPPNAPWLGVLPDGRDVWEVLRTGNLDSLPPCWIRIQNTGAYGDMIWSTSMVTAFVSDRFVAAITDAGFGGYQLLPLEVQPKRGERFSGYSLLLPDNDDPDAPIRCYPYPHRSWVSLDVSAEVMAALTAAGATDFRAEDASKRAAELIASAWEDPED